VIRSFADKRTAALSTGQYGKGISPALAERAKARLLMIDAALNLTDLRNPPGNRLEALRGDRAGQHSVRVNDQWRICFVWREGDAHRVEFCDYH
jgi:proteic killer suppression protein